MWRRRVRGSSWLITALLLVFWGSDFGLAQDGTSLDVRLVPAAPISPLLVSTPSTNPLLVLTPIDPHKRSTNQRSANLKLFLTLGAGTYVAAGLDMRATMANKGHSDFRENDPLAKPLTRLPAPAYYATGAAMITGINWISLRMARSPRWHRIWWLPQVCAIGGNIFGYAYSKRSN